MKKIQTRHMIVALTGILTTGVAYADHAEIDFPLHLHEMPFYCTVVADKSTEVRINTHNIDLQGACSGQYVTRPGHLKMPASVVNSLEFSTYQGLPRAGSITIDTPPNNPIHCQIGNGGRLVFGQGNGYC